LQVVLETEFDNFAALSLYESLGFIREKRLFRFYLNGKDAFRLVLEMPPPEDNQTENKTNRPALSTLPQHRFRTIQISTSEDEVGVSSR
jgi:peptide alpha-N-acetyltransferase